MSYDPLKILAVFEALFGPKLGRLIATLLLALITLFAFLWLGYGCWEYGGKQLYAALSPAALSLPSIESVLTDVQAAVLTMMFMLIVYAAILLAVLFVLVKKVFAKGVPQHALDQLLQLRNEGINTVYAVRIMNQADLDRWKIVKRVWETKLRNFIERNFPKSDYLFASALGVVPFQVIAGAFNEEHGRELSFVVRQLELVEQIANSYRK